MADAPFERARELAELDARLDLACAGEGGIAVVEGPAGIGKSRLLAEFRRAARDRALVLSARGSELEGEFAFGVVRQLFEAQLIDPGRREALLSGAAAAAAVVFGAPATGEDEGRRAASFAVLHGLFWLTLNLAEERPVVLCVDDLHWCDLPSLRFLEYLTRRLEGLPVLVVAGVRDGETGVDPGLLGAIVQDPAATVVRPGPLSAASVASILESQLGASADAEFVAVCHESTGGSPLLVTQLVTALRSEGVSPDAAHAHRVHEIGPRAVSRTVLLRLARLGPEARAVAQSVAILGDVAAAGAVAELSGVREPVLGDATRRLAGEAILRADARLAFVHPLVRDAVYHELSTGERQRQHARAASILADLDAPREQVAAQLLHTAPSGDAWVVEVLRLAAAAASASGAPESAVSYLRRALAEGARGADRARLLFDLGATEVLTSGPTAAEHLLAAYEELQDPADRAVAAGLLGRVRIFTGVDNPGAIALRAAAELPEGFDDLRMGLQATEFMSGLFRAGDPRRLAALREYRTLRGGGPGAHLILAMSAWEAVCTDGTAAECAEMALAALEGDVLREADSALVWFAAVNALIVADRPEHIAVWEPALADAYRRGSVITMAAVHLWYGFSSLRRGDLATAEESLRAAVTEMRMWGYHRPAVVLALSFLCLVLQERGRHAEAAQLLDEIGTTDPMWNTTTWWLMSRAHVLLSMGRAQEAEEAADRLREFLESRPDVSRLWWRGLKAEALAMLGRRDEAVELAEAELAVVRAFGAPSHLGRTLRVLGLLEGGEAGLERLREATAVLTASADRLEYAKALHALGAALRRAGRLADAREPLLRALELASACGVEPLEHEIRTELAAAGARPRRDAVSGVESLTPSERRVVELVAAGRANRDVAQSLYVTPKTVEVHLSSAYRKLGIRSRSELVGALAPTANA